MGGERRAYGKQEEEKLEIGILSNVQGTFLFLNGNSVAYDRLNIMSIVISVSLPLYPRPRSVLPSEIL